MRVDGGAGVGAVTLRDGPPGPEAPPRQATGGLAVSERLLTGGGPEDPATTADLDLRLRVGVGEISVREDRG